MRYHAFLSYSRETDKELAPQLRKALYFLGRPVFKPRALRIFLDTAALPASHALPSALKGALADSEFFVLLASPAAAESDWVRQELEWWLEHRDVEKLLIVLTGGTIAWDNAARDFDWGRTTALPDVLRGRFKEEPGYVDMLAVKAAARLSLDEPEFRRAVLDVAAPLHGKDKDLLDGEDVVQHRRRMRVARGAVVTLALLFVAASVAALLAWQQSETARSRELAASAVAQLAVDPELSVLLAREAVRVKPISIDLGLNALLTGKAIRKEPTLQAESALRRALQESHLRITVTDSDLGDISPDGRLAFKGDSRVGMVLWDLRQQRPVPEFAALAGLPVKAAFSPDGRFIAVSDGDGTVRLIDAAQWVMASEFRGHTATVTAFGFAENAKRLATTSQDGTVRVWDLASGSSVRFDAGSDAYDSIRFTAKGQFVLAWRRAGAIRAWHIASGRGFSTRIEVPEKTTLVLADAAVSPNGLLFVRDGRDVVRVIDPGSGQELSRFGGEGGIREAAFSPDCHWLVTLADTGTVVSPGNEVWLWDVTQTRTERKPFVALQGHSGKVRGAAFSPDSRMVVTAGSDHTVRVWRAENGEALAVFRAEDDFYYLRFTNNGRFVVTHRMDSMEGRVRVWEIPGNNTVFRHHAHDGVVRSVDFSPKAMRFLTTGGDATARLWDAETGAELKTLRGHADIVIDGRFSADGRRVVTAGNDHIVRVWDVDSGDMKLTMPHPSPVGSAGFSADGALIATGSEDGHVRVWRAEGDGSRPWRDLPAHQGEANGVAFHPAVGHQLASVGRDGWLRYWDADTGRKLWESQEQLRGTAGALHSTVLGRAFQRGIQSVSFSPDGGLLVTTHQDALLRTWHASTGTTTPLEFASPSDLGMSSADFSRNGKFLVATGGDGKARIWEVATGRLISVLGEDGETLHDASFSPDSRSVVTGSMNGDVAVYACEICGSADDLLVLAADRVTRSLKPEERVRFLHESPRE